MKRSAKRAATAVPDDVRGRVLKAAVRLIDEGGLASLSMREVARAAGVSHQAPYHYFPDRESILAALAQEGFQILNQRLQSAAVPGTRPSECLGIAGRVYVEFACDHPSMFRVMFRPDFVAAERFPDLMACGDEAFQMLQRVVRACIADGLPETPSERSLVVFGWSLVHGLACLLLDGPLAKKLPDAAAAKDELIAEVMAVAPMLIESRIAQAKKKKTKR
jgi:AcrR family transcriptional regulator